MRLCVREEERRITFTFSLDLHGAPLESVSYQLYGKVPKLYSDLKCEALYNLHIEMSGLLK